MTQGKRLAAAENLIIAFSDSGSEWHGDAVLQVLHEWHNAVLEDREAVGEPDMVWEWIMGRGQQKKQGLP